MTPDAWSGSSQERITRLRIRHRAHTSSPASTPPSRLRPSVAIVTRGPGRARAEATQCEQIKPWAALTTSQMVGHNKDITALRQQRHGPVTAMWKSSTVAHTVHNSPVDIDAIG